MRPGRRRPPCALWGASLDRPHGYRLAAVDVEALLEWYERVRRPLPWRATRDPYALLVSEVMLQQTQALRVVPYYERVAGAVPGRRRAGGRARAGRACALERAGLQPARAGVAERPRGVAARGWPADLTCCRGWARTPRPRCRRSRGTPGRRGGHQRAAGALAPRRRAARTPRELAARAASLLPAGRAATFNQAMMELGATVCRPRAPVCEACPVSSGCHGAAAGGPAAVGPGGAPSRTPTAGRAAGSWRRCSRARRRRSTAPAPGARAGRSRARRPRRPRPWRVGYLP